MESALAILATNLLVLLAAMFCLWLVSLPLRDASIADIFWGPGFVLMAWMTFFQAEGFLFRKLLIGVLVSVWGFRLAAYIAWRKRGEGEDRRYRAWRAKHGNAFWWVSLFTVFGTQGLLLWVISLVVQVGQISPVPGMFVWTDVAGILVWAVGFAFEAVGDFQLQRFKSDPKNHGKVMDRGLWAYTRHPNYFGECLVWWGIFLIALSTPSGFWTVISPLTITYLLLKVSGVTLLEKTMVESRPAYRDYIERTSPFFPWFPREKRS